MKEYHTTPSNKKYGIDNLPTDDLRLYDEEIKSAVEYERETMSGQARANQSMNTTMSADESSDFAFENSRSTKETKASTNSKETA